LLDSNSIDIIFMAKIHIKSKEEEVIKYIAKEICGLCIFFFGKVNNTTMEKYSILFT